MKWVIITYNYKTKFIDLGEKINIEVTNWIISKIINIIKKKKKRNVLFWVLPIKQT